MCSETGLFLHWTVDANYRHGSAPRKLAVRADCEAHRRSARRAYRRRDMGAYGFKFALARQPIPAAAESLGRRRPSTAPL